MGVNVCQKTASFFSGIDGVLAILLIPVLLLAMACATWRALRDEDHQIKYRSRDDTYISEITDRLLIQTATITIVHPFIAFVACLSINRLNFCYIGARGEMAEYPNDLKHMLWVLVPAYIIWAKTAYAWAQTLNEAVGGNRRTWNRSKRKVYLVLFPAAPLVEFVHGCAHGAAQRIVLRGAERASARHSQASKHIKCCDE